MSEGLLPERKPPEQLYHYTSAAGLKGIIESQSVWATKVQYMNDTEEFKHAIEVARGILARRKRESEQGINQAVYDELGKSLERIENVNICVFSLSEKPDLVSQWRAYCPPEGGYAVGFATDGLMAAARAQGFYLAPCIYEAREQQRLLEPIVDKAVSVFHREIGGSEDKLEKVRERVLPAFFATFSRVAPVIKHRAFREELEWRLVSGPIPEDHSQMKYRCSGAILIPFFDMKLRVDGGTIPPADVWVGPSTHMGLAMSSLSGLLGKTAAPWKTIVRSAVPYRIL